MTAIKTANVNARIELGIKQKAEGILARMGLPCSVAIDMFYRQIIYTNGLPFPVTIPQGLPTRDDLTDDEFDTMLVQGLSQAKANDSLEAKKVFTELRGRRKR